MTTLKTLAGACALALLAALPAQAQTPPPPYGPPIGIVSMVNILSFRDDEPSLVFVETDYSVEEVSKPESVQGYIESFERACDAALEPADTTGYLERLAKRME